MLTVAVNESEVKRLARERIAELVKEVDAEYVFWDMKELVKRTCMSLETMQATFFYDPRFPKHKVGGKWYFPARETRSFLIEWLSEQR